MGTTGSVFDAALEVLRAAPAGTSARPLLLPFEPAAAAAVQALGDLGPAGAATRPRDEIQAELDTLGGLSRLLDRLLLSFQPADTPGAPVPPLTTDELTEWMLGLGFRIPERAFYHPFFHEVVEVDASPDATQQPVLQETLWPCFMLDRLLVLRAGVRVAAGAKALDPELTTRSPMHFTGARAQRETRPAPSFRRDYLTPGAYVFNADGRHLIEPGMAPTGPMAEAGWLNPERIELLRYRCMVTTPRDVLGVDPTQDRFVEVR